jgi:hypothetical protein
MREDLTARSFRRRLVPPGATVVSQTAPRIRSLFRAGFSVHARRWHRAATVADPAAATQSARDMSPSRRRATPVTFVRPPIARAGGAPRATDPASAVPTTLRNIERLTTRTNIVARAGQPTVARDVPIPRVLHRSAEERTQQQGQRSSDRPAAAAPARLPAQPVIDVARLSDEVYRHIQRRVRIERERRGA